MAIETLNDLANACGGYLTKNRRSVTPHKQRSQPGLDVDTHSNVHQATTYLQSAKPSVQGEGGHDNAFKVACMTRDFGISEPLANLLMLDHWNERCIPPWMPDELSAVIGHAYRYGQNTPGNKAASTEFSAVEPTPAKRKRLQPIKFREAAPDYNQRWVVKGVLSAAGLSVVNGEPNAGKTFVVLDLSMHIARGIKWHNHKVTQGAVIYVATEAGSSLAFRIAAYKKHKKLDDANLPFAYIPSTVDLRSPKGDTTELIAAIKAEAAEFGVAVQLVVIDTLSRALAGGNENTSEDMGAVLINADKIREATGAHVLMVHHFGKDSSRGGRGWSGIKGGVDTEIEISPGEISITKQRDGAKDMRYAFKLVPLRLGFDGDGDEVTSMIVEPEDGSRDTFAQALAGCKGNQKTKRYALEALKKAAERKGDTVEGPYVEISLIDWESEFYSIYEANLSSVGSEDKMPTSKSKEQAWKRGSEAITEEGWVRPVQGKQSVSLNFR